MATKTTRTIAKGKYYNNKCNENKSNDDDDDDDDASVVSATNRPKDAITLNEQDNNHNIAGTTAIAAAAAVTANDALQNVNAFMEQQLPTLQHQQRIFIDQIFYLAQTGKLTLEDIMNETQSMVVVSFETVSSCIINALLCLAINRECQMKLRNEIKHILRLSKDKIKSKEHITTASTSTSSIKHNNNTKSNNSNNSNNKITTTFTMGGQVG
ncbi:hypothetical protein DOY81_013383 [Sarcophaga bullata]|nr:hypothetical protein DOY81_013383 [Sarcophaga bullata]